MGTLIQDVRYGLRVLAKRPGFTIAAVLTLALGIGLNTAIFSLYNSVLLRPLPARDPERLVSLYSTVRDEPGTGIFSYPAYTFYRDRNASFSSIAAYAGGRMLLSAGGSAPELLQVQMVSANFFDMLGAAPALGRAFSGEEDKTPGANPVVMLNYNFWQRHFGGDTGLVGRTITLNNMAYTVVGIAPRDFIGCDPEVPDLWVTIMMNANVHSGPDMLADRESGWLFLVGRLKSGVTLSQAQSEMAVLASQFHASDEGRLRNSTVLVTRGSFLTPGQKSDFVPLALALMFAVGLVLLIACANVANLQLARGVTRQKEMGVRVALGASRGRLVRQMVVESLMLSGGAGVAGLLIAWWAAGLALRSPGSPALSLDVSPDWRVAIYLAGISLLSGVVSGLMPALRASRQDPLVAIREESGTSTYRKGRRMRSTFVVAQVGGSLFLLIAAGLLVRALHKAERIDTGFDLAHVAVLSPDLQILGYDSARRLEFDRRLAERIRSLPGVRNVATATTVPLGKDFSQSSVLPEGENLPAGQKLPIVNYNLVSPEFFDTLGIGVVRGRTFTAPDALSNARVAVVNEALARQLWPGQEPIGKLLRQGPKSPLFEVVGVVRDTRNVYLWSANLPYLYLPLQVTALDEFHEPKILVSVNGNPTPLLAALPGLAREMDPNVSSTANGLEENLSFWIWPSQIGALLATTLGLLALLLASVGIVSVTSFAVSQRKKEIGIRMALGAQPGGVVRLLVLQVGKLIAIGAAIGLVCATAASRLLAQVLYGLSALDGVTLVGVTLFLASIALASCYFPARRATVIDPIQALREE
ncbi:MAG TPA: ABC transporter permease [Candidatus Acidoferrales bacterium]|nr:ABC transporter permease [Candidatus Acidoferrales bacterium]